MHKGLGINGHALMVVDIGKFFYVFRATYGDSLPQSSPHWCCHIIQCRAGEGKINENRYFLCIAQLLFIDKVKTDYEEYS